MPNGEILKFEGSPNETIYNPSRPLQLGGRKIIFARVEDINKNTSCVYPFVFENNIWKRINWPLEEFELEDPAVTTVQNKIVFSGVKIIRRNNAIFQLRTEFYYGDDIFNLEKFAEGPIDMKDIRLVELDNKIGVFTRPRGGEFGKGRIGYLEVQNLQDLAFLDFLRAKIIQLPISENNWVGSNDAYNLGDNIIGVLGHLASEDEDGNLHYSAMTFKFSPSNFTASDFKVIIKRNDFPPFLAKSKKVEDVVFPGGFEFEKDQVTLYCGLSDASIGRIKIKNPFQE